MKPSNNNPKTGNFNPGAPLVIALFLGVSAPLSLGADNIWTGASSPDWNNGANWSLGGVPDAAFGDNAVVSTNSPHIATIAADTTFTPNDIIVRGGGRLDHVAGTAGTGGGSWMFVGQNDSAGTYNLANTATAGEGITGFAQGSGSLNATGYLLVGAFGDNRTGTIRVNTAGTLAVSGELWIGDALNSVGNFSLESGTMTVNNKIFIGNNRGVGTLSMSGGTLTKTGGDQTFVGLDNGTGTLTQSGGTITLNHDFYVGQGGGGNGTLNLSGSAVLNTGRDFVIGREGGTGALNMTGGTITKTGDERMIVGHNNGTGTVVQSGGAITANNELYIGNENAGASGTYTLSGTGALTISNEVVVGRESGTGVLNVNGGTFNTAGNGNMYIGRRNGTGTLNQSNGVIIVNKEFGVGTRDDNKIGTGTYNLSGGTLSVSNNIFIGKELGSFGTVNMTGGTMTTSDKLQIGHNQSTGAFTQSGGTVNVQNEVYVGNETTNAPSAGTYTLSGAAVVNVGNEVIVGRDNGTGVLNLDGGTLNANKISGGSGSATVNFNGGVLQTKRDEGNLIEGLDSANIQSGGLKIDSNGFSVATSQLLTGTGGLEKLGAGQLTLSGPNTYAGITTVTSGVLRIEKIGLNATVDASANTVVAEFTAPPAPGNYAILPGPLAGAQNFTASGLGSSQQATFDNQTSTVTVTESDPYAGWIDSFTPNPLLPDAASKLPTADPDRDGITNLMEYVLAGGDPVVPSLSILPTMAIVGNNLVLSYTRNDESEADTTQIGQWTTDLKVWNDVAPVVVNENGALADDMTVTVPKSNAVNGKLFLRLKVTMP
jgi:autotransporter-associated beta strand protein/T5SS/PEP-CTERM-associated repeat protein